MTRWWLFAIAPPLLSASELVEGELRTPLVPTPVPYVVLLPDGWKTSAPLPLLLYLHGGGGDRSALQRVRGVFDELWRSGKLTRMVVATPSVGTRSFYMDFKDGSEKWETLLVGPFREHVQKNYNTSTDPKKNILMGASMGGMGSLRMGFKHPDKFGALAALEPGIEPILKWSEMLPRHRFWRSDALFEAAFGKPVDAAYWEANHPASIANADSQRLIRSGLKIYIEAGDQDMFLLHEGTEFLHRVLWEAGVPHEYHLVHGADHVGRTLGPRHMEGLGFLERALNPPPPDPQVEETRKRLIEPLKKKLGVR